MTYAIPAREASLVRKCPNCDKDMNYQTYEGFYQACTKNNLCRSCCQLGKHRLKDIPVIEKTCRKCGETKPLAEFYNRRKAPDGKQTICKRCQSVLTVEWARQNPERVKTIKQRNKEKDPEAFNAYHRRWKKENKGRLDAAGVLARQRIRKYSLTLEEEDYILNWKEGDCPICGHHMIERGVGGRRACIDHDHATGKFRDLICNHCNCILGHAQDNDETLRAAIEYLRRHRN